MWAKHSKGHAGVFWGLGRCVRAARKLGQGQGLLHACSIAQPGAITSVCLLHLAGYESVQCLRVGIWARQGARVRTAMCAVP